MPEGSVVLGVEIPDPFFYSLLLILFSYLVGGSVWMVRTIYDLKKRVEKLEEH